MSSRGLPQGAFGYRALIPVLLVLLSTDAFSGHQDSRFPKILENLRLQKRGTGGVDTAAKGGVFDISNLDRLGKSEVGSRQSWGGRFWNVCAHAGPGPCAGTSMWVLGVAVPTLHAVGLAKWWGSQDSPSVATSVLLVQVELVQLVIDGVNYLIDCERRLEKGQDIRVPSPLPQLRH